MTSGLAALPHRLREPRSEPEGALVLLHGRGADEHDLFPLLDLLDPEQRLLGAAPRGPLSLPPGGAHWYIVREIGYPDRETFHASFERLAASLDALAQETGVVSERTVLGGFSQGSVMAYALGLGRGRPEPAALVALSGFIPIVEGLTLDLEHRRGLKAALGHGTFDPVIGVEWGRSARERLEQAGAEVVYRESPMGHAVDPRFLRDLAPWVAEAVGSKATAR